MRNRVRVIEAAAAEFAEQGPDAQMEDVARRAGVGVGTLYRHFATKEALIDALLEARFRELGVGMTQAATIADPWQAILTAFRVTAEAQAGDRCFISMFHERKREFLATAPVMDELREVWGGMFTRAQAAGVMREDVGVADLEMLMSALAMAVANAPSAAGWERYLDVMTDGLRRR